MLSKALPFVYDKLLSIIYKRSMKYCGKDVYIRPSSCDIKGIQNLSIGNGSVIPKGSIFYCVKAPITIGNKVVFGPNPTIITGNHRIDVIGSYILDVKEKRAIDDAPVFVEDDVWVGANAIILKGVIVGRGSVIAAGSVVTKSVPPYAIVAGVPARILRYRWTNDDILNHEKRLYSEDNRLLRTDLERNELVYG